ncbi:protein-glutamate methylesterase/protein-glutamine glutaminase [Syntrophomonas erecta]
MKKTRVLVVDDSAFMRKVLTDIINSNPDMEVVGKARDGQDALGKVQELHPDVVTMDVEMPGVDGLTALARIMALHPVPVIMLSSVTSRGAEQTFKALQLGAVDFIPKPSGQISLDIETVKDDIIRKIKIAAGTRKRLTNFKSNTLIRGHKPTLMDKPKGNIITPLNKLLLIGTSTGGPKALHQVIPGLPANLNAGVLIVQHMPPGFTRSLAERLDSLSSLRVKEAEHGEKVLPGCVYIAPGDYHLKLKSSFAGENRELFIQLDQSPARQGLRPSVDVMFESAAQHFWSHMVCVIMTGMGNDGAWGIQLIKDKGGKIIAEHQSTCIVYGMPKAAVATGKVDKIVPLHEISSEVMKML